MRQEDFAKKEVEASWFAAELTHNLSVAALLIALALLAVVASGVLNTADPSWARVFGGRNRVLDRARTAGVARVEVVERVGEEEVLRAWLAAELNSSRFGERLRAKLSELGYDESLITDETNHDPERHQQRRAVIFARGVVWDSACPGPLFGRHWQREVHLVDNFMARARYAPHEGWLEMSGGSRMPHDVAQQCRAGRLNAAHTRVFEQIAAAYKAAEQVPPIILLDEADGTLTAFEGHARLTALALARLDGPLPFGKICVIVGYAGTPDWFGSASDDRSV